MLEQKSATATGESDAQVAQRLADEEFARSLQLEERAIAERSARPEGQEEGQSLEQDFEQVKTAVVEGAKSGYEKLSGFISMAKTEIVKKVDEVRAGSNNSLNNDNASSSNPFQLDDQDVSFILIRRRSLKIFQRNSIFINSFAVASVGTRVFSFVSSIYVPAFFAGDIVVYQIGTFFAGILQTSFSSQPLCILVSLHSSCTLVSPPFSCTLASFPPFPRALNPASFPLHSL